MGPESSTRRAASATAAVREPRPSLCRMFAMWRCTVCGLTTSCAGISRSSRPCATTGGDPPVRRQRLSCELYRARKAGPSAHTEQRDPPQQARPRWPLRRVETTVSVQVVSHGAQVAALEELTDRWRTQGAPSRGACDRPGFAPGMSRAQLSARWDSCLNFSGRELLCSSRDFGVCRGCRLDEPSPAATYYHVPRRVWIAHRLGWPEWK